MHHECDEHSDTCEVCIVVNNFHSADLPNSTIEIPSVEYTHDEIKLHHISPVTHIYKGFYSTAPPSL